MRGGSIFFEHLGALLNELSGKPISGIVGSFLLPNLESAFVKLLHEYEPVVGVWMGVFAGDF